MTVQELREECERRIGRGVRSVTLVLPDTASSALRRRLAGRAGPYGEILSGNGDHVNVSFDCAAVVRWLNRNGI